MLLQVYSYGQTAHSLGSEPVVFETGGKSHQTHQGWLGVVEETGLEGWGVGVGCLILQSEHKFNVQECIPVGCVPPVAVAVQGGRGSASVHAVIHPPRYGPGDHPARTLNFSLGCGPGDPPPPRRPARHAGIPPAKHAGIPPPAAGHAGYQSPHRCGQNS